MLKDKKNIFIFATFISKPHNGVLNTNNFLVDYALNTIIWNESSSFRFQSNSYGKIKTKSTQK